MNPAKSADFRIIEGIASLKEPHDVVIVALDGWSGSGKTTIARRIAQQICAVHVHCDDCFVGGGNDFWVNQTTQYQIDHVMDWRRILNEVIMPLRSGRKAIWQPAMNFYFEKMRSPETFDLVVSGE
jgi:uridine kinase